MKKAKFHDDLGGSFEEFEPAWRICHVCRHRYDLEITTGSLDPCSQARPLVCPRCGVLGRDPHLIPFLPDVIRNMYGFSGGASRDGNPDNVVVHALMHARSPGEVERIVDAILEIDAGAIAENTPPWDDPVHEAERLRALEWIRKDVASGLHERRLRDLGAQASAELHAEREHHLELLRRRKAAGLR